MKKIITIIILLFTSIFVKAQQSDILYVPDQQSLVVSHNYRQIGIYIGGYYVTTLPYPYIYTTPMSIMNRIGLTYVNKKNTYSIMGGAYIQNYIGNVTMTPDVWIKIYPIRIITKSNKGFDFAPAINYMGGFRYGIGLSIPF
jgi:hypothetical protein